MVFTRSARAAGLLQLVKAAPDPLPLLSALRYHLEASPSDPDLSADAILELAQNRPSFLTAALAAHPDPAVIDLVFSHPSEKNLVSALRNPALSDDQYARIARLYESSPSVELVGPLLRTASPTRTLPKFRCEHLYAVVHPAASGLRGYVRALRQYSGGQASHFAAYLLEIYLGERTPPHSLLDSRLELLDFFREDLSLEDRLRVVDAHLNSSPLITSLPALSEWLASTPTDRATFIEAYRLALYWFASATTISPVASPLPLKRVLDKLPPSWSIPAAADALLEVLDSAFLPDPSSPNSPLDPAAQLDSSSPSDPASPLRLRDVLPLPSSELAVLEVLAGREPLEHLPRDLAGAHQLLEDAGLFSDDELRAAGVYTSAARLDPVAVLQRGLPSARLSPAEASSLLAALRSGALPALLDPLPAPLVVSATGLGSAGLVLPHPDDPERVTEVSPLITEYLLEVLGSDPSVWAQFASLIHTHPKLSLGEVLTVACDTYSTPPLPESSAPPMSSPAQAPSR